MDRRQSGVIEQMFNGHKKNWVKVGEMIVENHETEKQHDSENFLTDIRPYRQTFSYRVTLLLVKLYLESLTITYNREMTHIIGK